MKTLLHELNEAYGVEGLVVLLVLATALAAVYIGSCEHLAALPTDNLPGCTLQSATRNAQGMVKVYQCKE